MRQDFLNSIKQGAIDAYKQYKVRASLTGAQAALESNFGTSAPGNNLFGIKWTEGCGYDKQLLPTWEVINGKEIRVNAYFRKYDSLADSIIDHAKLLTLSRYKPVIAAQDYKEACRQVQACGYATDPNYASQLIGIIEQYKLYEWDEMGDEKMVYKTLEDIPSWGKPTIQKLIGRGSIKGDGQGNINLSDDTVKILVILDREGVLK